jgi:CBS domain-containing protein
MVGMAAMVAGATRGPLMAILILFEMTGEYRIILPLMLSCITAMLVSGRYLTDSIFTLKFARAGLRLGVGRESAILRSYQVQDVMEYNPVTIPIHYTIDKILRLFLSNPDSHYYVTDAEDRLVGRITIHDVKDILHAESLGKVLIADDIANPVPHTVTRLDTLEDCLLIFSEGDESDLPVLERPENSRLVGIVSRQAIFEVYNREVLHKDELGIKLVHSGTRFRDCVDLPEAYKVQLMTVPPSFWGHSIRQLQLRQRYGVSVLAVKMREGLGRPHNELPDPDRPLKANDRLIVVGHVDALGRMWDDIGPGPGTKTAFTPDAVGRGARDRHPEDGSD